MDRITQPLISIIVPAYNCEKYIEKCIDSILHQTYQNFELIIINDGSKDNTLEKISTYNNKSKITVISIENNGVSNARNLGIKNSKGDYICFIDSDDWVEKEYLESFVKNITDKEELLIQDIIQNEKPKYNYKLNSIDIFQDTNILFSVYNPLAFGGPVCKLFNSDIIKSQKILFDTSLSYGEDLVFFLNYLKYNKKIKYLPFANYHYIYNSNSLSTKKYNFENYLELLKQVISFKTFVKINESSNKDIRNFLWDYFECALDSLYYHKTKTIVRLKKINILKKIMPDFKISKDISINRKIILYLIKYPLILDCYQLLKHSISDVKK